MKLDRTAEIARKTKETDVIVRLKLDGGGAAEINTGVGFLDHMLTVFTVRSGFDLFVSCKGDTFVDDHHSVEDVGIALGQALSKALGECRGITRYGSALLPMDEALILCAVDISGRGFLRFDVGFPTEKIGSFDTELIEEFMRAFAHNAGVTLHLVKNAGNNSHHIAEGAFKALGCALRGAVAVDGRFSDVIPSSKGVI
ncbi:MAG: imidazoleglycerol-phosphate dehydratase HisB [Clostridia bacterium]|nr:imidazoleglycerol-phosphate dehydratase HisB [Clostridia bacterium]